MGGREQLGQDPLLRKGRGRTPFLSEKLKSAASGPGESGQDLPPDSPSRPSRTGSSSLSSLVSSGRARVASSASSW